MVLREEDRSRPVAGDCLHEALRRRRRANHRSAAGGACHHGRGDFRLHSAGAPLRARRLRVHLELVGILDNEDWLGIGIDARVARVQVVHIREQEEPVGLNEVSHLRTERVVVAEANLFRCDCIILVHDGHHAEVEEFSKGVLRVQVLVASVYVWQCRQREIRLHSSRCQSFRTIRYVEIYALVYASFPLSSRKRERVSVCVCVKAPQDEDEDARCTWTLSLFLLLFFFFFFYAYP